MCNRNSLVDIERDTGTTRGEVRVTCGEREGGVHRKRKAIMLSLLAGRLVIKGPGE